MNNDLKLIENELVPVYETDKGEKWYMEQSFMQY